jgi:hypothetical protein
MFQEAVGNINEVEGIFAPGCMSRLLQRKYVVDELAVGSLNNRLQACVNLLHLLARDRGLNEPARLLVTQLTSEIALLRSVLHHSIEPLSPDRAIAAVP